MKLQLNKLYPDLKYNIDEPDGGMYMIDHAFAGCMVFLFSEPVSFSDRGSVYIDGIPTKDYVLRGKYGTSLLGIKLRGKITEYGQSVHIRVEGFANADGNMQPADFDIISEERALPLKENAEHEAVALKAAEESIVLLKNANDVLPLPKDATLNIFGEAFHAFRIGAVGAGRINPRYSIGLKTAINEYSDFTFNKAISDLYISGNSVTLSDDLLQKAKAFGDIGIVVLGRASGENFDNKPYEGGFLLTQGEEKMIETITKNFAKSVVIINSGYPIDVSWIDKYGINCVVYCGYLGMRSGEALVKVLDGRVNPSGKLTDSWAYKLSDIPADKNFYKHEKGNTILDGDACVNIKTVYEEDIYVGYRYFDTFDVKPAFAFGFGLSYTEFSIQPYAFAYEEGKGLRFSVSVKNIGKCAGKQVVQVYVGKPDGEIETPAKELVEFAKTETLQVGQEQTLDFFVPQYSLTVFDEQESAYIALRGEYAVYVGDSSSNTKKAYTFRRNRTTIEKRVKLRAHQRESFQTLSKRNPKNTYPQGSKSGIKETTLENSRITANGYALPAHNDSAWTLTESLSVKELARLSVGSSGGWGMENIGEAARIYDIPRLGLPLTVVADGNSGVNIKRKNIGMPSGQSICASFNRALAEDIGRVIGEEARENHIAMILAPGMNIHRHPLCGRQPEYFSEEPLLAGSMAGHYCKGLESAGVGGCYKHCVANNAETARSFNDSVMTERALREIYFKAFEIALQIHSPVSIMTAYNRLNGIPTCADADLLQGLFREENGFDGFIMTDWGSYNTVPIEDIVNAGNCWLTPGSNDEEFTSVIEEGVRSGKIDLQRLKDNVYKIIKSIQKIKENKQ